MRALITNLAYFWAAVALLGLTAVAIYFVGLCLLLTVGGWIVETLERLKVHDRDKVRAR